MNGGPRWRAGALLVGAFIAGIAVGAIGVHMLGPRFGWRGRPTPARAVEMLSHRLGLRPAQRDSIKAIFERRRPAFDSLWHQMSPRLDSLEHAVSKEIEQQLDPDQRTKYAELRKRFAERRRDHPPMPPPSD